MSKTFLKNLMLSGNSTCVLTVTKHPVHEPVPDREYIHDKLGITTTTRLSHKYVIIRQITQ